MKPKEQLDLQQVSPKARGAKLRPKGKPDFAGGAGESPQSTHCQTDGSALGAPSTLAETLAQYRAILASALDPIVTINFDGIIQSVSDSIQRVFGYEPQEVLGRNVTILMPSPHREAHDTYMANYRRTGVTNILGRTREFLARRKDGTVFPIELSVSRVEIPGKAEPLFTGIIHDITERRQLETELQQHRHNLEELVAERTKQLQASHNQLRQSDRLASIGTLAAGLGHDMNNVLLPIRARLDALDAAALPASAKEHFQAVRRSIAYLQQLSDGLHLLALDPEDANASSGATNLNEWWNQVGPLLLKALPKRITFHKEFGDGLPMVAVPPHRLTQAVLNLIVNAGEAISGEGEVRITAQAVAGDRPSAVGGAPSAVGIESIAESRAPIDDSRRQAFNPPSLLGSKPFRAVRLAVSDTGEGMTEEVKRRAMDPFFTTKKRGLGTGLGLSLVRGVAQSAGGTVEIESQRGKGTTVTLVLPASEERGGEFAQRRAAVWIDDARSASFMGALLEAAGFAIVSETSRLGASAPECEVWVVEPKGELLPIVRGYLRADRSRRAVVFGSASAEWLQLGALVINNTNDLDNIRDTLGQATAADGGGD
jgi:two-component system sensor kinase FixL